MELYLSGLGPWGAGALAQDLAQNPGAAWGAGAEGQGSALSAASQALGEAAQKVLAAARAAVVSPAGAVWAQPLHGPHGMEEVSRLRAQASELKTSALR